MHADVGGNYRWRRGMFMHPILMVEYRLAASRCRRWRRRRVVVSESAGRVAG